MSTLAVNTITNAAGGNTAQINGMTPTAQSLQGFRNRIINGNMVIDQRNAGASVSVSSQYTLDRWYGGSTLGSKYTVQQNAGSVTPPTGFSNYLGATSSSAYAVLTGDTFWVQQSVEGFNVSDLGWGTASAQAVTLTFWVRSSLTGTFGGAFTNSATNRSYPFAYTISAANTWEQKTITVAGDTSGTWLTTNGIGISVRFGLGSGATFSGTAGAWAAGNIVQPTGSVSVVGTNGATFYITGVQLEAGSVATPFERRDYTRELIMCQRYFYNQVHYMGQPAPFDNEATGAIAQSSGTAVVYRAVRVHPVEMRATPTVTFANIEFWDGSVQRAVTTVNNNNSSKYNRSMDFNMNGNMTALGRPAYEFLRPSGFIACSAEL
jgi:hypothetical protein